MQSTAFQFTRAISLTHVVLLDSAIPRNHDIAPTSADTALIKFNPSNKIHLSSDSKHLLIDVPCLVVCGGLSRTPNVTIHTHASLCGYGQLVPRKPTQLLLYHIILPHNTLNKSKRWLALHLLRRHPHQWALPVSISRVRQRKCPLAVTPY